MKVEAPKRRWPVGQVLLAVSLAAVLASNVFLLRSMSDMRAGIPATTRHQMAVLTSTWTDASGTQHTIETTQHHGETYPAFVARHAAALAAAQQEFPPA